MKILFTSLFFILTISLIAQNNKTNQKPSWMAEGGLPQSEYYDYYIGLGENENLQKAREAAIDAVYISISNEIKASYNVKSFSKTEIKTKQDNSGVKTETDFEFVGTVEQTGENITVTGIREVEIYSEKNANRYQYWVLYRKPKAGTKDPKLPLYTFDKSMVWRSVVYSGWGQMYNRQRGKGTALLCGETAGLAGVIVGQLMYASNINSANATTNYTNRKIYLDNAKSWETIRNISGIVAGAVWIFNIIDATSASKPKLYSLNNDRQLHFYPNVGKNYSGVMFCVTF